MGGSGDGKKKKFADWGNFGASRLSTDVGSSHMQGFLAHCKRLPTGATPVSNVVLIRRNPVYAGLV
jgi:hypothetical protein